MLSGKCYAERAAVGGLADMQLPSSPVASSPTLAKGPLAVRLDTNTGQDSRKHQGWEKATGDPFRDYECGPESTE